MMQLSTANALLLLLLQQLLSAAAINGTNPSGNCTVPSNNGAREGYHSPGLSDSYLPDCQNPLQRELWRVFMKEDGTSYVIPRPDGLGIKYIICSGSPMADDTLATKALEYGLCDEDKDPSVINSMDPAIALEFTNIFHRRLIFEADVFGDEDNGYAGISPWVPDTDILDVCEKLQLQQQTTATAMSDATKGYCLAVRNRCDDEGRCNEIGIEPSRQAVEEIVPALNELYGIKQVSDTCLPEEWGVSFGCPVARCAEPPVGCDYVFDHFVVNGLRDCCAELCYSVDSGGNECVGNGVDNAITDTPDFIGDNNSSSSSNDTINNNPMPPSSARKGNTTIMAGWVFALSASWFLLLLL